MQKSAFLAIVLGVLLLSLHAPLASAIASSTDAKIVYPGWAHPAAVLQGDALKVVVACPLPPSQIKVSSPDASAELEGVSVTSLGNAYLLEFSLDVPPGLYDLAVKCRDEWLYQPRSLAVYREWPERLRIAQITDTHIGLTLENGRTSDSYLMESLMVSMLLGSDVLIHTGDAVDVGAMAKDYAKLSGILNLAGIPTFVVPGNHDYSGDSTLSNYREFVGESYYVSRWGPYLFIGLDTGYYGTLTQQQLDFIESVLSANTDALAKVVFFHHPVFNTKYVGKVSGDPQSLLSRSELFYSSWRGAPDILSRFLALVDKYNVSLVLSGHTHADGLVLYNNKTYFVTTVATGGGVREGDYRGLKIIDLYYNGTVVVVPREGSSLFDPTIAVNLDNLQAYFSMRERLFAASLESATGREIAMMTEGGGAILLRLKSAIGSVDEGLNAYVSAENADVELSYSPDFSLLAIYIKDLGHNFRITFAVSETEDGEPPHVSIAQIKPAKPIAGKDRVEVVFRSYDDGWGIKRVYVEYRLPSGSTYSVVGFPYVGEYYSAKLPLLPSTVREIEVRAVAEDMAGHSSSTDWVKVSFSVPATTLPATPTATDSQTGTEAMHTTEASETSASQGATASTPATTVTMSPSTYTGSPPEKSEVYSFSAMAIVAVALVVATYLLVKRKSS